MACLHLFYTIFAGIDHCSFSAFVLHRACWDRSLRRVKSWFVQGMMGSMPYMRAEHHPAHTYDAPYGGQVSQHFISCCQHFISCFQHLISCCQHFISCFQHLISCCQHLVSCFQHLIFCCQHLVSCFQSLLTASPCAKSASLAVLSSVTL